MSDRTAISEARTELHTVLKAVSPSTWRIHRTSPAQITAPMVYIDSPTLSYSGGLIRINFPVVMIVDGAVTAQIEQLDDLLAAVWTAAANVGTPTTSAPASLDVGGPSLRAQVLNVEVETTAITMCPPTLITTAGSN